MVGVAELESATPCVSCKCSNQLSYTPVYLFIKQIIFSHQMQAIFYGKENRKHRPSLDN